MGGCPFRCPLLFSNDVMLFSNEAMPGTEMPCADPRRMC